MEDRTKPKRSLIFQGHDVSNVLDRAYFQWRGDGRKGREGREREEREGRSGKGRVMEGGREEERKEGIVPI